MRLRYTRLAQPPRITVMAEEFTGRLLENTYVRIGGFVAGMIFLAGIIVHETTFRTNLIRDIQDLRKEVILISTTLKELNDSDRSKNLERRVSDLEKARRDAWDKNDMLLWILETEKLNPDWHPARIIE